MKNIPWELWFISLGIMAVVGVFIGAWMAQNAEKAKRSEQEDQILLWKTKYESHSDAAKKNLCQIFDHIRAELCDYQDGPGRPGRDPQWLDGYNAAMKNMMAWMLRFL